MALRGGIRAKARKPLVIDLAHRAKTVLQALAKLDKAVGAGACICRVMGLVILLIRIIHPSP